MARIGVMRPEVNDLIEVWHHKRLVTAFVIAIDRSGITYKTLAGTVGSTFFDQVEHVYAKVAQPA